MTTRLTDQVLANVHGDMQAGADLDPMNNMFMAEVLNRMDIVTVDGYDADAAAASLFAFATVLRTAQLATTVDATPKDVVEYLASMATLTGQALHAQTHVVAEAPEPERTTTAIRFDSIPWTLDRRAPIPTVLVGERVTTIHLEVLRQYRAARGLRDLISVMALTAAEVNQAVTWWNHRAAMLSLENPR